MRAGDFKHRVALCSAYDDAVSETVVLLRRQKIVEAWARIEPMRGSFTLNGYVERENRELHSHIIWLRWAPMLDISGYAWVFEERARSGPRWWKVLSVREEGEAARFWRIEARLVERGGDAARPSTPSRGLFAPKPLTGALP